MPARRRKERSGPGIMNCDEFATTSSGGEDATISDGFELATVAKSSALAQRQQQEKSATTRMERRRGYFTAGLLLKTAKANASRSTSQRAGIVFHPRNGVAPIPQACDF